MTAKKVPTKKVPTKKVPAGSLPATSVADPTGPNRHEPARHEPARHEPDRRVAKTKQALRAGLIALLGRKPFSTIQVTEIVVEADLSRPTFYLHYRNSEDLLIDVLAEIFTTFMGAFEATIRATSLTELRLMELPYRFLDSQRIAMRGLLDPQIEGLLMDRFVLYTRAVTARMRHRNKQVVDSRTAQFADEFIAGGCYRLFKLFLADDHPDWQYYAEQTALLTASVHAVGKTWVVPAPAQPKTGKPSFGTKPPRPNQD